MIPKFTLSKIGQALADKIAYAVEHFEENSDNAVKAMAEEVSETVKGNIESQNFAPLVMSERWRQRKAKEGLDPRVLIATKGYLQSIRVKHISKGRWGIVADVEKARYLELGTKTAPAKPHWKPVLRGMEGRASEIFADQVLGDLLRK